MSSANSNIKKVCLAAVQMVSQESATLANLEQAKILVDQAAREGAEFVLLPEFMPTGYLWDRRIWQAAEPKEGPTVRWLSDTSARLRIWLGTSFLESDGEDFFNTFVLTTPEGVEAGRVPDSSASSPNPQIALQVNPANKPLISPLADAGFLAAR